jgi:NAD(P)-dependent dehydrogenase (short-subunit alcohol dehydrogenase family)
MSGFDLVVAARTVREGDGQGGLPGSLEAVAGDVRAAGREVLECRVDLLDHDSCAQAVHDGVARFGRIDVLVNSGLLAEGEMQSFEDTPMDQFERAFAANVLAPLHLVKLVVPSMRANGGGVIVNISSGAGANETRALPGAGGWPLAYSITKAAFNRLGPGLAKELRSDGIAVVNLEPGVVATERMVLVTSKLGLDATASGVAMDVPGSVCAYIATHRTPMVFSGRTVDAPQFSAWSGLVDGESLPFPNGASAWGAPPVIAVAGGVTGVESGLAAPPPDA